MRRERLQYFDRTSISSEGRGLRSFGHPSFLSEARDFDDLIKFYLIKDDNSTPPSNPNNYFESF